MDCEEGGSTQSGPVGASLILDRIVSIEPAGSYDVYDIEVAGTHSYVLGNGICSYNCQDIEYSFLDVVNETMSASLFWGFAQYFGTPKTTDTTLALLWRRSSQAEWVIRCEHCGHYNVPNPEQDLLHMIGKTGPVCAKCGKDVSPVNGGYVHAIPEKACTFPGYHISQTIHPLHVSVPAKWRRLLLKMEDYDKLTLYNEVFGWPYDASTSPLVLGDLLKARHDVPEVREPSDIEPLLDKYRYITVGVDWSGGGAISDSYTALAVMGLRKESDVIDVLYGTRFSKDLTPTEEAREVLRWISGTCADAFTYDNGGAGFVRLETLKHEGLMNIPGLLVVPINYVGPSAGDVMKPHANMRESDMYYYTLDKSRSLAICIQAIKASRVRMPWFAEDDAKAVQRDFLALCDDPRKTRSNDVVIVIIKRPGVPDDWAHAVNFGCAQIWDHFGAYPRVGTRYDASLLDVADDEEAARDFRASGPRGDFERFMDAVDLRPEIFLE